MDTPTIAEYYRETEPMKRLKLLETSIAQGEEPEANAIRKEIWDIRYNEKSNARDTTRADGFLGLWMLLEFNKNTGKKLFGSNRHAVKEVNKLLDKMQIPRFEQGDALQQELIYREICHMVRTYMTLCKEDRSYNTYMAGLLTIKKEAAVKKLQKDVIDVAVNVPEVLGMQKELSLVTRAAGEVFEEFFPGEGGIDNFISVN